MAEIGKINHLEVVKKVDFGVYLDGDELGEILLPERDVPPGCVLVKVWMSLCILIQKIY